jgi:hypothetical protein
MHIYCRHIQAQHQRARLNIIARNQATAACYRHVDTSVASV